MTATFSELRPLRIGQVLDQAVRLYRRNFLKFIGIVALVDVPMSLLIIVFSSIAQVQQLRAFEASDAIGGSLLLVASSVLTMGLTLINGVLLVLASAAIARDLADQLMGRPGGGVLDAYRRLGPRWKPLLGALVFAAVFSIALVILILIPCIGWLSGLGVFFFYSAVVQQLLAPIAALEEQRSEEHTSELQSQG